MVIKTSTEINFSDMFGVKNHQVTLNIDFNFAVLGEMPV